jgi:hypothetical protein
MSFSEASRRPVSCRSLSQSVASNFNELQTPSAGRATWMRQGFGSTKRCQEVPCGRGHHRCPRNRSPQGRIFAPFSLPEVPRIGDYISIHRPDVHTPLGEDLIVRKVWWGLSHPATGGGPHEAESIGRMTEIFVECDTALGPHSSEAWGARVAAAKARDVQVEEFEVDHGAAGWGRPSPD